MASGKQLSGRTRTSVRSKPYDINNPANWTNAQLKDALNEIGIVVNSSYPKTLLFKLYNDNINARNVTRSDGQGTVVQSQGLANVDTAINVNQNREEFQQSPPRSQLTMTQTINNMGNQAAGAPDQIPDPHPPRYTTPAQSDAQRTNMAAPMDLFASQFSLYETAMQTAREAFQTARNKEEDTGYTLESALNRGNDAFTSLAGPDGVPADALPSINIVSDNIRKKIVEGKDINLHALLINGYDGPNAVMSSKQSDKKNKFDPRMVGDLNLADWTDAFTVYKEEITSVYPNRLKELTEYEKLVRKLFRTHGVAAANEYNRNFSAKAAMYLQRKNVKIAWSCRDKTLYDAATAGRKPIVCDLCHSAEHKTSKCELNLHDDSSFAHYKQRSYETNKRGPTNSGGNIDKRGRVRVTFDNKEICNNFNEGVCKLNPCPREHRCAKCKSDKHDSRYC